MKMSNQKMFDPFWLFHRVTVRFGRIHNTINEKAEFEKMRAGWRGKCLVEVSGMDCDSVKYSGHLLECADNYYAYKNMIESEYLNAEGPIYFQLITHDEASEMIPRYIDLAMEAYEDGHPSTIYY